MDNRYVIYSLQMITEDPDYVKCKQCEIQNYFHIAQYVLQWKWKCTNLFFHTSKEQVLHFLVARMHYVS